MGDRLERTRLVLRPDREPQLLLAGRVGRLDQLYLGAASTSSTSTTPAFRRRSTSPVVHQLRSRCHESPAACSACQIVYVLTFGSPSGARRSAPERRERPRRRALGRPIRRTLCLSHYPRP